MCEKDYKVFEAGNFQPIKVIRSRQELANVRDVGSWRTERYLKFLADFTTKIV